jgi:hypothetical protein
MRPTLCAPAPRLPASAQSEATWRGHRRRRPQVLSLAAPCTGFGRGVEGLEFISVTERPAHDYGRAGGARVPTEYLARAA